MFIKFRKYVIVLYLMEQILQLEDWHGYNFGGCTWNFLRGGSFHCHGALASGTPREKRLYDSGNCESGSSRKPKGRITSGRECSCFPALLRK
jgi:hypothetical protein